MIFFNWNFVWKLLIMFLGIKVGKYVVYVSYFFSWYCLVLLLLGIGGKYVYKFMICLLCIYDLLVFLYK